MKIDKKNLTWFIIGIVICAAVVVVDLLTKQWATKALYLKNIVIIENFFKLTYVRTTGAAWGIFSDATQMLSVVSIITGIALLFAVYCSNSRFFTVSTCLIIGGAIGNLYERIVQGFVTDFLAFNIFGYEFPRFNIADSCIVVGCILLVIYILFLQKNKRIFRENTPLGKLSDKFSGQKKGENETV